MTNDELKAEYQRLIKLGWDRVVDIDKRRKERHANIKFDNPLFLNKLKELEKEMEARGLK
jgi:hypothetical protein